MASTETGCENFTKNGPVSYVFISDDVLRQARFHTQSDHVIPRRMPYGGE